MNEPAWTKLAEIVGAEVSAGSRVLDVGAGPGEPTVGMDGNHCLSFFLPHVSLCVLATGYDGQEAHSAH
ncbi:MAG: hypothetical protein ACPIOQ_71620, partial [Promethearchaeia archaeon]